MTPPTTSRLIFTPWFPADVSPARDGVYQREYEDGVFYCLYKGGIWHGANSDFNRAKKTEWHSFAQRRRWRGLVEEPKEMK